MAGDGGLELKPGAGLAATPAGPVTGAAVGKQPRTPVVGDTGTASAAGTQAVEAMDAARNLAPAYLRAVTALDAMAAIELARGIIAAVQLAHRGTSPRLATELPALETELAIKLGPQQLDGAPVMGSVVPARLGGDPVAYLVAEASTTAELLGVVAQVRQITGAAIGMCPPQTPGAVQAVIYLVEPWRSRPINFAFLIAALRKLHVWDEVAATKSNVHGKTLGETQHQVAAQARETGALADVGGLDTAGLGALLHEAPPGTKGARPGGQLLDDRMAGQVLERLAAASPPARGPLVQQIARMGKLGRLCDHLPKQSVQALHDAIEPFDPPAAAMLVPFFTGKPGGGRSMHQIYEDKIMGNLRDGNPGRGYLWTLLDTAHNALTFGFEHDYSQAYDAREAGALTDEGMHRAGAKALAKAGAIAALSTATGAMSGAFGEGVAAGLGAGKPIASLIGAGVGGFGAGVGGHLAGDVFDQAANGKHGFDPVAAYMRSGAAGGITGTILGGLSVGAGHYLSKGGGQARPIDQLAERYPQHAGILERFRAAGFGTGAGARATAAKIKLTAAELAQLIESGLVAPQPAFATALGRLPPGGQLEISARPPPMQMAGKEPPRLDIDEIKPLDAKPDHAKPGPRAGDIQPDELEHFDKGHFTEEGKLTGGAHGDTSIAELQRRGYEELPPEEVAQLRDKEKLFEEARNEYIKRSEARNVWDNAQRRFRSTLDGEKQLGQLKNPNLPAAERSRLEVIDAKNTARTKQWEADNPRPPSPGKAPKPEAFGLEPKYVPLAQRRYYYHEPLGSSGAKIGGVSSKSSIHLDGHTWFPPGWKADPIMKLLETKHPGITETTRIKDNTPTSIERSAWINKDADGAYSIAPPQIKDPKSAGYLKTKMITPVDGGQRTVFAEMRQ